MAEAIYATFHIDDMLFGIAVGAVQEVLLQQAVEPVPKAPHAVVGVLTLRGRILAVTDVRTRLGLPAVRVEPAYFVVRDETGTDVLTVDSAGEIVTLDDNDQIPVPQTTPAAIARHVLGAHEVDEHVMFVVDLSRMLHTGRGLGSDIP